MLACLVAPAARVSAGDGPPVSKLPPLLVEDFESTPVGAIPAGFTSVGKVAVAEDFAASGKKSLRIEAANRGPRRIILTGDVLTKLGGQFWGRLYYRVQTPYPHADPAVSYPRVHSTIVAGSALSPQFNDDIEVRLVDTIENTEGLHEFDYNVQTKSRGEFGKFGPFIHHYTNEWTLAEWSVDYATQSYHLYINGQEITDVALNKGASNFTRMELPEKFTSLAFGWNNYQAAAPGFVVWVDDLALGKERIGPRHPAPAKPVPAGAGPH